MGDGILKSKPPRPKVAISQSAVYWVIFLLSFIIAAGLVAFRKSPSEKKQVENEGAAPSQVVSALPASYSDVSYNYPPPSRPAENSTGNDELLKALMAKEAQRIQRAASARLAPATFQGFSLPQNSRALMASGEVRAANSAGQQEQSARDDVNRQDDKLDFLSQTRSDDTALHHGLLRPVSPYQLLAGTIVPGLLLTGVNSDLPGQLLGQVSQNVFDTVTGAHLLIPQGTKILGTYDSRIVYGQERVLIVWTRLIFPNGNSLSLEGMPGVDLSGYAGLSDQVDNHYLRLLSGVMFSSLLGAAAQMAEGPTYDTSDPSFGQLAVQGVARNTNQVGQEITRRNLNIQPTLIVRPGYRFNLYVHKDITLEPYNKS